MLKVKGRRTRTSRRPARGRDVRRRVGGHRRSGPDIPVHAGTPATSTNNEADQLRRQPGPGQGRRELLAARGRGLRPGRRLLHLDPGWRRRGDRPRHRCRRLRQRLTARSGPTTPRAQQLRLVYQSPGTRRPRLPGQRDDEPARDVGAVRGQHQRQLPARVDPQGGAVRHRPDQDGQHRRRRPRPASGSKATGHSGAYGPPRARNGAGPRGRPGRETTPTCRRWDRAGRSRSDRGVGAARHDRYRRHQDPVRRQGRRGLQAHRGDLRGEPQLRQPLRRLGHGRRPARSTAGPRPTPAHTHAGRPGRHAVRLPAAERRQPHRRARSPAAAATPSRCTLADGTTATYASHFAQRAVQHRQLHPADRHDLPAADNLFGFPNGVLKGQGDCPAAAPATWSTASTRSSTSSTAASRTAT